MKITVRVKPNARKNEVVKLDEKTFVVHVNVPPVEGKANEKVIELLANYFGTPKRGVTILRGSTGKSKLIEIL
jgi:uncharacterized protein (TIGR00251 family)